MILHNYLFFIRKQCTLCRHEFRYLLPTRFPLEQSHKQRKRYSTRYTQPRFSSLVLWPKYNYTITSFVHLLNPFNFWSWDKCTDGKLAARDSVCALVLNNVWGFICFRLTYLCVQMSCSICSFEGVGVFTKLLIFDWRSLRRDEYPSESLSN